MAKNMVKPNKFLDEYIRGLDSIPNATDLREYKKELYELLKRRYKNRYITLYRGFTSVAIKHELGEIFTDPNAIISFTQSKQTAIEIAKQRSKDTSENGFAIKIDIPIDQIFFHYIFDEVGREYPKEKEVIICPYGFEWDIIFYTEAK